MRSFGAWLNKYNNALREWRIIASRIAKIVSEYGIAADIYVFGSVVKGRYTGASDIDVLIIVNDDVNLQKLYRELSIILEDKLGNIAYIVDLHIITKNMAKNPPYRWWLEEAIKITQT